MTKQDEVLGTLRRGWVGVGVDVELVGFVTEDEKDFGDDMRSSGSVVVPVTPALTERCLDGNRLWEISPV